MIDRSLDIANFKLITERLVAKNDSSWDDFYSSRIGSSAKTRDYSMDEINQILNSSSLTEQQTLSQNYFRKNGFYKRIIWYYATILFYSGILIPNPRFGKKLSEKSISKRYFLAQEFVDKIPLEDLMIRMSVKTLLNGSYYGIIQELNKDELVIFDLPTKFCRSRYKDTYGNSIVEFNVSYFYSITDEEMRQEALDTYPEFISQYFKRYNKGRVSNSWVIIPSNIGICFSFLDDDNRPLFLDVIPATVRYDDAVDTEQERELEEIRKIIVQKIPHLNDGQLLFEPEEAAVIHEGTVGMMKKNKNVSILTTYADVDAIVSKTSAENVNSSLDKMLQNTYATAGASAQVFSPTGTQALPTSIKNDMALMMVLANKFAMFITTIVNTLFSNGNISFKYKILPLGVYNQSDYITDTLKLAQAGYSFILPGIASGLSQQELVNIKSLENEALSLGELLIPLSSSYTQSSSNEVGAPAKRLEDKSPKTIQNEDALDHQGGSDE